MRLFSIISVLSVLILFSTAFSALQTTTQTNAQPSNTLTQIKWMSWTEAIEANKKVPKKIFVDIYTHWCGWCKRMDATTFKDAAIVEIMSEKYYAVKLNAEMKDTIHFNNGIFVNPNPNGRRSAHQLASALLDGKMSYPSFVVLTHDIKRIQILPGYKTAQTLQPVLKYFGEDAYINTSYEDYLNSIKGKK